MAYKVKLDIATFETVMYDVTTCEKYLNGTLLANTPQEVEIYHGDNIRIVYKSTNVKLFYSKNGEDAVELQEGTYSLTLPPDNYRIYDKVVYDGNLRYDISFTFKHPLEGTKPVYKRVNGGWRKQTAYERADGMWVKISTTDTISFTIDGETWYARSGMTWSEWCNANDYSLNSWHIYGTRVSQLDNSKYILGVTGDSIIRNTSYQTSVFGDGNLGEEIAFTIEWWSYRGTVYEKTTSHTALEGMTWLEFCDSPYNDVETSRGSLLNYYNSNLACGDYVLYSVLDIESNSVSAEDVIIADKTYYLISHTK